MRYYVLAILVTGLMLSAPVLAGAKGERGQDRATIATLERHADALKRDDVHNIGAVGREKIARQRAEIRELIGRLEAGKSVDPAEVDRVLGQ